ncbi:hypothetical protein PM082_015254 [Marasmius tenuissimus]|nr:hypothetical protein PM082_015254 [Marasmius tenuissimus]
MARSLVWRVHGGKEVQVVRKFKVLLLSLAARRLDQHVASASYLLSKTPEEPIENTSSRFPSPVVHFRTDARIHAYLTQ